MKTRLRRELKIGLVAFAMHLGVIASVSAGGASLLQLPIEGVTPENSDQCAKLFGERFRPVLIDWKDGDVKMIKQGATIMVQLRPDRGQVSLGDVEKALKGSPFSIKRDQLEYFSLLRLRIGKVGDPEKHIMALATLDGKKLQTHSVENEDGSRWITLREPSRNLKYSRYEERRQALIAHRRLTRYLSENKIELLEISWGNHPLLEPHGESYAEVWRGESFGAQLVATAAEAGKQVER